MKEMALASKYLKEAEALWSSEEAFTLSKRSRSLTSSISSNDTLRQLAEPTQVFI